MRITQSKLRQIIKEELETVLHEAKLKDFIKSRKLPTSIPGGSLSAILRDNPELKAAAGNPGNPAGQIQAFQEIGALLAQDSDIRRYIGDDPIERHLDVGGFLKYAEQAMAQLFV
jgi:hypothetical protein